jgi:alkylhydroperoxidase family enzyme
MVLGEETVRAALADPASAPIDESLRATLAFLRKVTREHEALTTDDVRALLALGVTRSQIEEALDVAFAFNVITRLADTFEFEVGSRASFDAGAKHLLKSGYNS